jgi:hypothetical protein
MTDIKKMDIDIADLKDLLRTKNKNYLRSAFLWIESAEGQEYWEARASGKIPLSPSDFQILRNYLAQAEAATLCKQR